MGGMIFQENINPCNFFFKMYINIYILRFLKAKEELDKIKKREEKVIKTDFRILIKLNQIC